MENKSTYFGNGVYAIPYACGSYKDPSAPEENLYEYNGELRILTVKEGDTPRTTDPARVVSEDEAKEWARGYINDKNAKLTMTSAGKKRFPDIAKENKKDVDLRDEH